MKINKNKNFRPTSILNKLLNFYIYCFILITNLLFLIFFLYIFIEPLYYNSVIFIKSLPKIFIFGVILFILYIRICKPNLGIFDIMFLVGLIFQFSLLIDFFSYCITNYWTHTNLILYVTDPNLEHNIPKTNDSIDIPRIIRYASANIAALGFRRPLNRMMALTFANAGNIIADILGNEARSAYWMDNLAFFQKHGRIRGGQPGSGPFERGSGTGNGSGASNFFSDFDFFKNLFTPVDHSIPLETLFNIHFVFIFVLFIMVFTLIILYNYFLLNLIIVFNKEFFLNKVKNKYVLLYVKYVLFKSRVDIVLAGVIIFSVLCFILYVLHYLIVHPIIYHP